MPDEQQKQQEANFLRDVKDHQMTIIRDNDLDRHIRFRRPGTICYGFDIITWSGHLIITGDCGTWVFARIPDMFDFFRTDRGDWNFNPDGLSINPHYWSEKLLANDARGRTDTGPMQFSEKKFREAVCRRFDEWTEGWEDQDAKADLFEALEEEVLSAETEADACKSAADFEKDGFRLEDFWDENLREWTHGFIWNCFAIVWGIRQYDASRAAAATGEAA